MVFLCGRSGQYLSNDAQALTGVQDAVHAGGGGGDSKRTNESLELKALELTIHSLCCRVQTLGSRFRALFEENEGERFQKLRREVGIPSKTVLVTTSSELVAAILQQAGTENKDYYYYDKATSEAKERLATLEEEIDRKLAERKAAAEQAKSKTKETISQQA